MCFCGFSLARLFDMEMRMIAESAFLMDDFMTFTNNQQQQQ
jgi:hypothetical protein